MDGRPHKAGGDSGAIDIVEGKARRQPFGRVDYTLRIKVGNYAQPLAIAVIEAKAEHSMYSPADRVQAAKQTKGRRRLRWISRPGSRGW